jgi:hypothetical protein
MKFVTLLTAIFLAFFVTGAFALQDDRIRGEVVSVDPAGQNLEIKVLEVGSNVTAKVGATESFYVPDSVDVEFQIENQLYQPNADFELEDISKGDTVLLDFRTVSNRSEVTRIRSEQTTNVAVRDRIRSEGRTVDNPDRVAYQDTDQDMNQGNRYAANDTSTRRSALPDSASALPMAALFGLFFAMLAGAIRFYCR